jgi:hypothetical protein
VATYIICMHASAFLCCNLTRSLTYVLTLLPTHQLTVCVCVCVCVVGAFYTDNFVVLFDALIREKYIREEELGPRLKLPNEEVRKIVVQVSE